MLVRCVIKVQHNRFSLAEFIGGIPEGQAILRLPSRAQVDGAADIWRTMVWGPRRRRPDRQVCPHLSMAMVDQA